MNSNELIDIENIETEAIEEEKENAQEQENVQEQEVELSDEKKKEVKKEQITALVTAYYNKFDFLQNQNLSELINKSLNKYLDTDLTIEEINDELMQLILIAKKEDDKRHDGDKVKDNHKELYEKLDQLVSLLATAGIDYQLAGALCSYLKYGEESKRIHDDIDLNMNEDDLGKFGEVCRQLGFDFHDNRMNSPRVLQNGIPHGDHEVVAEIPGSDLHIGVFCFQRNPDGSINNRSYYKDEEGNNKVWNEYMPPEFAKLVFGAETIEFNGKPLIITPPEYVYSLKSFTRQQKDLEDIKFMEDKIDKDKLARIREAKDNGRRVDLLDANPKKNDDIESMMNDKTEEKVEENSMEYEKPKVYVKNDNNNNNHNNNNSESGFIHYRGLIVPYIVLLVMVAIIEIFNFLS